MYLKVQFEDCIFEGNALPFSYCGVYVKKNYQNSLRFENLVLDDKYGQGKDFIQLSKWK